MLQQAIIQKILDSQKKKIWKLGNGFQREILPYLPALKSKVLVVSGIRRCGKNTLIKQLLALETHEILFLSFDDPRLSNFELSDFETLDKIIENSKSEILFFAEIHLIKGWEVYVRKKLDEGFRIAITSSNVLFLSSEFGIKLTGRYVGKEFFTFSYREFLKFKSLENNAKSLQKYIDNGSFPEFLKTNNTDILTDLFNDILNRCIIARYGIRDVRAFKNLVVYLISNVGNRVTANKLLQMLGIKTAATVLEYFSFLEDSYLLYFMPKFSYSSKVQMVNPRKVYVIDGGMVKIAANSFSDNRDKILENTIYLELRRGGKSLYYFDENDSECDFVVMQDEKFEQLIQVCYELLPENREREMRGLREAMSFFQTDKGKIITFNQRDSYIDKGNIIEIVPAWEWLKFKV